jgi:hypothetical protein
MYDDDAVKRALRIARLRRAYWSVQTRGTAFPFAVSMRAYLYWDRHVSHCLHALLGPQLWIDEIR